MKYLGRSFYKIDPFHAAIVVCLRIQQKVKNSEDESESEMGKQIELLREVVGNPFCPVTVDPKWVTPTVKKLAQFAYDKRHFDDLPILADVLEEAGCEDVEILEHCRSEAPHMRGCWVIDLLLGKQ